jgi:hypothetical protein
VQITHAEGAIEIARQAGTIGEQVDLVGGRTCRGWARIGRP